MKKFFYSILAVALCSCTTSEVDDAVTAPQPEKEGVKFVVVDNGYQNEDGTRVQYGAYDTEEAYKATFEEGDAIGVYAIRSSDIASNVPTAYVVQNAKLTLTDGIWKGAIDFEDADLLFAYAPYRENVNLNSGKPSFVGEAGSWAVDTGNNRFFVHPYNTVDNGSKALFDAADWMGAAVNLTGDEETITFNMIHMRGMVELTTDKNVVLSDLKLAIGSDSGTQYTFTPYFVNQEDANRTKNVYRILTTEYRSQNTVYATIEDLNIVKKYKKTLSANSTGAGKCAKVNISYTPAPTVTVGAGKTLAETLTELYGEDYATNEELQSLRLKGELQGADAASGDWATLRSLTTLKTLDMYNLTNESIPANWLCGDAAPVRNSLTTLILPNVLTTINMNALQVGGNAPLANIDIPASVTSIGQGAFWYCYGLSIRIPEDSRLQTIGQGAFYYVKAVYTYENNNSLLVLPSTLTSIGGGSAFYNIGTLKKVVFKGETAPTIDSSAFNSTSCVIYVPQRDGYYGQFPGKTVAIAPTLTVDNYSSPYTSSDSKGLAGLCDDDYSTYWHTPYAGEQQGDEVYGQYIDITLPAAQSSLAVQYVTRAYANATPTKIDIYVGNDGETWEKVFALTKDDDNLPQDASKAFTTELQTVDAPFTKVRFAITEAKQGSLCGTIAASGGFAEASTSLAELAVYEDMWTEE